MGLDKSKQASHIGNMSEEDEIVKHWFQVEAKNVDALPGKSATLKWYSVGPEAKSMEHAECLITQCFMPSADQRKKSSRRENWRIVQLTTTRKVVA